MDLLANIAYGFQVAIQPEPLLFCFVGVTLGTFIGVLPGIGPLATISMLLPITYYLQPTSALIMLAGIFYGAQYGGSTASILLNTPGTATSAVTCLDGYPLTKKGRAGAALFITTTSSFVGGSFAILLLMLLAPTLAEVALSFGSGEYFAIMVFGLIAGSTLATGSPIKGIAMVVVGVILGLVGVDLNSGRYRFTFGLIGLSDGLNLVAVAMGLFGVSEILANVMHRTAPVVPIGKISLRSLIPTRQEVKQATGSTVRGSIIGAFCGIMPGAGATIASFIAYAIEKRIAVDPSRFGKGAIEGIASPEAANNASAQADFIPTLSLGIPGDAVTAVMLGAMMIHGIIPGPNLVAQKPDLFWGLIASFWIGNVILVILNMPLVGIWVRILKIPYSILYPAMLFFICIGVYSTNNSVFDIILVIVFGFVGYAMMLMGFSAAPLLLGFILGPLIEIHLRRALLISDGDFTALANSYVSGGFLIATAAVVLFSFWSPFKRVQ